MKNNMRITLTTLALALGATAAFAATPKPASKQAYNRIVSQVVKYYQLPGIAVGVIDHGKVVYKSVRGQLPSSQPMNANTLFELGSTTKAMTVSLLAHLAQQGKLDWKAPVTRYLPAFRMHDAWVTKNMHVGDLLEHHSGLPGFAGDLMLWPHPSHFTPEHVVKSVRYLKPAYSFRAGYAYDNVLYVVAGQVASKAGGAPYATLLRREVFQPLGMSRCQVGTWNRDKVGNVARPHVKRHGHYVPIASRGAVRHATTMDPAGGASCSLNDMLIWARNWLAPTPRELKWLAPVQRRKEWTPHTPVPISQRRRTWNNTRMLSVGRGWFISNPDDVMNVWHTGVLEGMRAAIVLFPYSKSGFVVLMNSSADSALTVLDEELLKQFTAPGTAQSVASYATKLAQDEAQGRAPVPDTSSRQPATSAELQTDLGVWKDPWFGKVTICPHGNTVHFASLMSPLLAGKVMRVGKRYLVQWKEAPDAWLEFPAHAKGTLHMALVNPNADASSDFHDLAFTRVGDCP